MSGHGLQSSIAIQALPGAAPAPARPRALRADLVVEPAGQDRVEVRDPLTGRCFGFDEPEWQVLEALGGGMDAAEIALELFGDSAAHDQVARFIERVGDLGLLRSRPLPARELAARQAHELCGRARARRDQRVAESVRVAATELSFYRERIGAVAGEVHGMADLPLLPTTSKQDFRDHFPSGFIPAHVDLEEAVASGSAQIATTSGSTGGRLAFIRDNDRDVVLARLPGVSAVPGGWESARIARFTTPLCSGAVCHLGSVPFEQRILNGTLHLNSSERVLCLRRPEVDGILADLERFQANVLQVDPVYAVALVRALERFRLPVPSVDAVLSFFEYCSVLHREILVDAFRAPLTDFLSAADLGGGVAAFSCERGRFHVNERENVFEFLRRGRDVEPGEIGEITVTSLNHRFTRLIRYRLGDLATPVDRCGCGYDDWPAFQFEGRVQDCLIDTAGRPVTTRAVDQLFDGLGWVDFYQLVQPAPDRYQLLAIRRPGSQAGSDERTFLDRARGLLGAAADLQVDYLRELAVEPSFKYPLTRRMVPAPFADW